ncbi:MAG: metal-dependent hydrolase [Thermaerobacter sp.]|nr:metal-dependent hydrolase [Thermaerobacter sp.]
MQLTFLGHAAWLVETGGKKLLFDPFLTGNPAATRQAGEIECDYVLISHAHGDHIGDAEAILRRTGATCVTTNEIAGDLSAKGIEAHGMHLGGKQTFDFGSVKLVVALHGSGIAGGHACGFLIESEGKKLYFAGDTALTTDMQLLRDVWGPIDIALLPVGSYFTMDVPDAAVACRFIEPRFCVPMHYGTFPLIAADIDDLRRRVAKESPKTEVVAIAPGQSHNF